MVFGDLQYLKDSAKREEYDLKNLRAEQREMKRKLKELTANIEARKEDLGVTKSLLRDAKERSKK